MTEAVLWLSILASAAVGFGLGWWWFAGSAPAAGSASVARLRAAPDGRKAASSADPAGQEALRTLLNQTRSELTTLHASLDQTRTERDTLRAEVDRAHRTIRQLEAAEPRPGPSAPTDAGSASPPARSPMVPSPPQSPRPAASTRAWMRRGS